MNIKRKRIENSVKHIVGKGCSRGITDYVKMDRDGLTDFCNLVRYQVKCDHLSLQDAADFMVYQTKFN